MGRQAAAHHRCEAGQNHQAHGHIQREEGAHKGQKQHHSGHAAVGTVGDVHVQNAAATFKDAGEGKEHQGKQGHAHHCNDEAKQDAAQGVAPHGHNGAAAHQIAQAAQRPDCAADAASHLAHHIPQQSDDHHHPDYREGHRHSEVLLCHGGADGLDGGSPILGKEGFQALGRVDGGVPHLSAHLGELLGVLAPRLALPALGLVAISAGLLLIAIARLLLRSGLLIAVPRGLLL